MRPTNQTIVKRASTLYCLVAVAITALSLSGCASNSASPPDSTTIDKAQQTAMTPDEALARLKAGNERFVAGNSTQRDYISQQHATASGQYPYAIVLSCVDSRSVPEIIFDQGIGDIFVTRVAGNYAPIDMIGSMEFATKVAGAKLIVVMGHTECGAIKGACDNIELGNLTTVIQSLRPAVEDVKDVQGDRNSKNKDFVYAVTVANIRHTVAHIRSSSPILRELEQSGQIKIVGAMHDISTGKVTFYDWSGDAQN
jgi:carbonic anhydrase